MGLRRLRLRHDHGFTLTEMLVVLIVIGALLLIAVPSYLGFAGRAEKRTAASDVRAAASSAEAYRTDNETYTGMTLPKLEAYDSGVELDDVRVSPDGRSYCLDKSVGANRAYLIRGAAPHTPAAPASSAGEVDETGLCPAAVDDTSN